MFNCESAIRLHEILEGMELLVAHVTVKGYIVAGMILDEECDLFAVPIFEGNLQVVARPLEDLKLGHERTPSSSLLQTRLIVLG